MFVSLALSLGPNARQNANNLLALDAPTISFLMESAWSSGGPGALSRLTAPAPAPIGVSLGNFQVRVAANFKVVWDHLIYAYMIENTRAYEVMGRVLAEYTQGERLGILQIPASYQWLRTTEELFYKDASPFQPNNLVSRIRPDVAATRRNAYYRMFGMDLNHGRDGASQPYPYVKPTIANRDFVGTFEEFLRDVWRAIENVNNFSGANPTDFAAIADLAIRLQNMLTSRRGGAATRPNLSREEFLAICLASWLELTLSVNSPIVVELSSTGPSAAERLRQIGDRVGLPAHGRSHNYFLIARRVSRLLIAIEQGLFSTVPGAQTLAAPGPTQQLMNEIVHHWQLITGRDIKSARTASQVAPPVGGSIPATSPSAWPAATPTNGKVPAGTP